MSLAVSVPAASLFVKLTGWVERCADYAIPICNVNEGHGRNAADAAELSCIAICALHKRTI